MWVEFNEVIHEVGDVYGIYDGLYASYIIWVDNVN